MRAEPTHERVIILALNLVEVKFPKMLFLFAQPLLWNQLSYFSALYECYDFGGDFSLFVLVSIDF